MVQAQADNTRVKNEQVYRDYVLHLRAVGDRWCYSFRHCSASDRWLHGSLVSCRSPEEAAAWARTHVDLILMRGTRS